MILTDKMISKITYTKSSKMHIITYALSLNLECL